MKIKILCKVLHVGEIYATEGQEIVVPDEIGQSLIKDRDKRGKPRVEEVKGVKK